MAIERSKRAVDTEGNDRNVRRKSNLQSPCLVVVTNMEPTKLEVCWSPQRQRDFRSAQMYAFLREAENLPPIDVELVTEYIANYDPEDGSSVVKGHIIGIDESTLQNVLHLPIGELAVGVDVSSDFRPGSYFKGDMSSLEKNQGWKVAEAITPELMEWMRFVQKRLGLNRHTTYMSKRLLYAAIGTLEGMVFNWAAFVATRIHAEMVTKRKTGKFASLLCSNYVHSVIVHTLRQPVVERNVPSPIPQRVVWSLPTSPPVVVRKIGESNRSRAREATPVTTPGRAPIRAVIKRIIEIPISNTRT